MKFNFIYVLKNKVNTVLKRPYGLLLMVLGVLLSSCGSIEKATYFYDVDESTFAVRRGGLDNYEPILSKNDLLSISVGSVNSEAAEIFNKSSMSATQSSTSANRSSSVSGYLIDQDGFITFPVFGKIMAAGKTKKALTEEITNELKTRKLLIEPIVDIRYLNFKISVLGEVKNPSVLTVPSEKISILEALGLAGDITIYGKKDDVVLIREENGARRLKRLNLTSDEIFTSPYYYLKSNDIIYVKPNEAKVSSASQVKQWIPVILSAISLAVVTVVTLGK